MQTNKTCTKKPWIVLNRLSLKLFSRQLSCNQVPILAKSFGLQHYATYAHLITPKNIHKVSHVPLYTLISKFMPHAPPVGYYHNSIGQSHHLSRVLIIILSACKHIKLTLKSLGLFLTVSHSNYFNVNRATSRLHN